MACLVFHVPCALPVNCLAPPILFPDNWLTFPTCFVRYPHLFAPSLVSLCLQPCAGLFMFSLCFLFTPKTSLVFPHGVVFVCSFGFAFSLLNKYPYLRICILASLLTIPWHRGDNIVTEKGFCWFKRHLKSGCNDFRLTSHFAKTTGTLLHATLNSLKWFVYTSCSEIFTQQQELLQVIQIQVSV